MARSQSGESVLLRAVRLLEAFSSDAPTLSVTTTARSCPTAGDRWSAVLAEFWNPTGHQHHRAGP